MAEVLTRRVPTARDLKSKFSFNMSEFESKLERSINVIELT